MPRKTRPSIRGPGCGSPAGFGGFGSPSFGSPGFDSPPKKASSRPKPALAISPLPLASFEPDHQLQLVDNPSVGLPSISPKTLVEAIKEGNFSLTILDCRYPFEYQGGHIIGAKNWYLRDRCHQEFFDKVEKKPCKGLIIFHCEFSSARAPNMYRFMRETDRNMNADRYPALYYPEMYILMGGYKAFYNYCREIGEVDRYCDPPEYVPQLSPAHCEENAFYSKMVKDQEHTKSSFLGGKKKKGKGLSRRALMDDDPFSPAASIRDFVIDEEIPALGALKETPKRRIAKGKRRGAPGVSLTPVKKPLFDDFADL